MNKKERKASKRLEEAQKMVANFDALKVVVKPTSQPKVEHRIKIEPRPLNELITLIKYTVIMKAKKGEWHVYYQVEGDNIIRDKKCKSKTQAEDWVAKHSK